MLHALGIGFGIMAGFSLFVVVAVLTAYYGVQTHDWLKNLKQPKYTPGGLAPKFESEDPFPALMDAFAESLAQADIAKRTRTAGHYVAECRCSECKYDAEHGGINMQPFMDDYGITLDGKKVIAVTAPLAGCTCIYCRELRPTMPEFTLEQARQNLEELNKVLGYAL